MTIGVESETVKSLLSRLASGSATPGGGAAAALAAATAAALVAMVRRVTTRGAVSGDRLAEIVANADQLRERLTALIAEDIDAYQKVLEARRLKSKARAALEAGSLTAGTNLEELLDGGFVRAVPAALDRFAGEGETLEGRVLKVVAKRVRNGIQQ